MILSLNCVPMQTLNSGVAAEARKSAKAKAKPETKREPQDEAEWNADWRPMIFEISVQCKVTKGETGWNVFHLFSAVKMKQYVEVWMR